MAGQTCPLTAREVLDKYFLENRARLLEVAAFLDRVDRAGEPEEAKADFRYLALKQALDLLAASETGRAKALQLSFSDPTVEPIQSAAAMKGAFGAWSGGRP